LKPFAWFFFFFLPSFLIEQRFRDRRHVTGYSQTILTRPSVLSLSLSLCTHIVSSPSSAMSDEPSLPRMPPSRAADAIFGPNRKRVRLFDGNGNGSGSGSGSHHLSAHALLLNNSSDPAVFSSDDDPALDNYALPDPTGTGDGSRVRKKKRYVGAWFAQHPASTDSTFDEDVSLPEQRAREPHDREPQTMTLPLLSSPVRPRPSKNRRTFERQFDSGVWMGKEGIAEGDEDQDESEEDMAEVAMAESPPPPSQSSTSSQLSLAPPPAAPLQSDFPPPPPRQRRVFQRVPSLAVNSAEEKARKIVQECIEAGDDKISLMYAFTPFSFSLFLL
jgi:hypothetical protein